MNNKQIQELRVQLLELEKKIELNIDGDSVHAKNRRELAKESISSARYHLHELSLITL